MNNIFIILCLCRQKEPSETTDTSVPYTTHTSRLVDPGQNVCCSSASLLSAPFRDYDGPKQQGHAVQRCLILKIKLDSKCTYELRQNCCLDRYLLSGIIADNFFLNYPKSSLLVSFKGILSENACNFIQETV